MVELIWRLDETYYVYGDFHKLDLHRCFPTKNGVIINGTKMNPNGLDVMTKQEAQKKFPEYWL